MHWLKTFQLILFLFKQMFQFCSMRIVALFLFSIFFCVAPAHAQDNVYSHSKEHKRVWKKWRKNRQSYNPYLEKKKRNKPSAVLARENKREMKRQQKRAKRQKRKMRTGK